MQTTTVGHGVLDSLGVLAVQVAFALAAITPLVTLLLYKRLQVGARRAEIAAIMKAAFGKRGEPIDKKDPKSVERGEARELLDKNPYISDPDESFISCHSWRHYWFPVLSLAVLSLVACGLLYAWVGMQLWPELRGGPVSRLPVELALALAGGYIWSLSQLLSRAASDELSPADLAEINLGLLSCVPIGYAFSLLAVDGVSGVMAFVASAFPVRETKRLLQEQALKRALGTDAVQGPSRPTERHLATAIDGVSDQALVRLRELRIVTVLDMAYSDPIKIMLQSGYSLQLIIDWMDQSLWSVYAGDARPAMIKHGIRCSLDVYEFVELHCLWDKKHKERGVPAGTNREALEEVAKALGTTPVLAHDLFLRIYGDPQVKVLRRLWYVHGAPEYVSTASCP
jgi:hypothetical protein